MFINNFIKVNVKKMKVIFTQMFSEKNNDFTKPYQSVSTQLDRNVDGIDIYIRKYDKTAWYGQLFDASLGFIYSKTVDEIQRSIRRAGFSVELNYVRIWIPIPVFEPISTTKYFRLGIAFCMPTLTTGITFRFHEENIVEMENIDMTNGYYEVKSSMRFNFETYANFDSVVPSNVHSKASSLWETFKFYVTETCIQEYHNDVVNFCNLVHQIAPCVV